VPQLSHQYKGSEIVITEGESGARLTIDGVPTLVEAETPTGPYWTIHTPYVKHQTVVDLAHAVVDHRQR
jgi:hypothetical protein